MSKNKSRRTDVSDLADPDSWLDQAEPGARRSSKGKPSASKNNGKLAELPVAEVVASHGRHFLARDQEGQLWQVYGKGKKREVAVCDLIRIEPSGDNQAWIDEILPRRNLLYRSDAIRSKLFAANLDQVVLVLAISPPYSGELLGRTLAACADADIPLRLVFNKVDLLFDEEEILNELQEDLFDWTLGEIPIHWVSLTSGPEQALEELRPILEGQTSLILGQSGMGKSTLINLLIPEAQAPTNDVSMALNAGKHTTTHTRLHETDKLRIIDSPGFQAFGLHHLSKEQLDDAFPEISETALECRFDDCQHLNEPDCAVKLGVEEGEISPLRLEFYLLMSEEIRQAEQDYD